MSLRQAAAEEGAKAKGPEPSIVKALRAVDDDTRADVIDCIDGHDAGEYDAPTCARIISGPLGVDVRPDWVRRFILNQQCPPEWRT